MMKKRLVLKNLISRRKFLTRSVATKVLRSGTGCCDQPDVTAIIGALCVWKERATFSKRNSPDADGFDQGRGTMFEYSPPRLLGTVMRSRLIVGAAVIAGLSVGGAAIAVVRHSPHPVGSPPPAVVPVVDPTNALVAPVALSPTLTPTASATPASPRPNASARRSRVSASPAPTRLAPKAYEGDSSAAVLANGTYIGPCSGCPDGTKVRHLGDGSTLTFPDVEATVDGDYTLTIAYADGDASAGRDAIVTVDGTAVDVFFASNGQWNTAQTITMTVHLAVGENSIQFSNPNAMGPDIAEIVI